jgi:hypothetical protein
VKRLRIDLAEVAARDNLLLAVARALRGKRHRPAVQAWLAQLEAELAALAAGILHGSLPQAPHRRFTIHDPKTREISAAPLAERVLHHALMNLAEPRFEAMLVPDSYACRPGKGVHAAVAALQQQLRRWREGWWLQMDVQAYFASIDHARLLALLARRFKGDGVLALMARIVHHGAAPGATAGLPIGSLTSQHFANAYLDAADRWLLARPEVLAHVRYMDDIVVCAASREAAQALHADFAPWLLAEWGLTLKPPRLGRCAAGLLFCGHRVRPGVILPSPRRMQRYRAGAQRWWRAVQAGAAAPDAWRALEVLQATLAHTASAGFRRSVWAQLGGGDG